jgi:hypothetical protein
VASVSYPSPDGSDRAFWALSIDANEGALPNYTQKRLVAQRNYHFKNF